MTNIELIINIDEKDYNYIKELGFNGYKDQENKIIEAIANSIVIPKGHGRLIDSDKMIKELNERIRIFDEGKNEILKELDRPEENNQIPLWLWKGCCKTCGIIIEADKEKNNETDN